MRRNDFLKALGGLAACTWLPALANAPATDPGRLSMLIPAGVGGGWDTTGRALGAALQEAQRYREVAYENKGGSAGTIGLAHFLQNAPGNPHALLMMGAVMIGGLVSSKSPLRLQQCTPIARLTTEYSVFAVTAGSPLASLRDVAERLKKSPDAVRFGGGSRGSTEHIATAMFARSVRVAPRAISYAPQPGGADALAALYKGDVDVIGSGYGEFAKEVVAGRLRVLGITSQRRLPALPDLPTLKEQGHDVIIGNWRGVYGAPGINAAQREALTQAVADAVKTPAWRQAVEKNGWTPAFTSGKDFQSFVEFEFAAMGAIMYLTGML